MLGRRLFWDPRGPTCLYPQFEVTLGDPTRVSWSGLIDDPDDPVRLVNRLEATALGCAWLLDRWGELRDAAGGRAGPGSRPTGSRRSACWAASRWTSGRTSG